MNIERIYVYMLLFVTCVDLNEIDYLSESFAEVCPYTNTCKRKDAPEFPSKVAIETPCCSPCSCESDCWILDKCCHDAEYTANTTTTLNDEQRYMKGNCLPSTLNFNATIRTDFSTSRYYAIDYCPNITNSVTAHLCTSDDRDYMLQVPFVSDKDGIIYKNQFCAQCNGVENYTLWKIGIRCKKVVFTNRTITVEYLNEVGCYVWSVAPEDPRLQLRNCDIYFADCGHSVHQDKNDMLLEKACHEEQTVLFRTDQLVYKNAFCYLCRFKNIVPQKICLKYVPAVKLKLFNFIGIFGVHVTSTTKPEDGQKCSKRDVYDMYMDKCRPLNCPPLTFAWNGMCKQAFVRAEGIVFEFTFNLDIVGPSSSAMSDQLIESNLIDQLPGLIEKKIGCAMCSVLISLNDDNSWKNLSVTAKSETMSGCPSSRLWEIDDLIQKNGLKIKLSNNTRTTVNSNTVSRSTQLRNILVTSNYMYCPAAQIHINDLRCPSVVLTGEEYLYALRKNILKPRQYDAIHNLTALDEKTLRTISIEVCIDEYFEAIRSSVEALLYGKSYTHILYCIVVFIIQSNLLQRSPILSNHLS